jgi:D-arabinose 1-dehydrogenase-like Zn-dependent alcohol dehydrogenase
VAAFAAAHGPQAPSPARSSAASPETQEMLDFCGQHNITSDVEMIRMDQINEAYERMLKSDVKYRFVIDMASLR